ncbi:hypothetical protein LRM36_05350 [Stenotrophomonas maltophilia]|nr:hypothetical protein [Stenotrophomonas maltophilia]
MDTIEKKARHLLAAEYERRGSQRYAEEIRDTELSECGDHDVATAIMAVIAALNYRAGHALVPMMEVGVVIEQTEGDIKTCVGVLYDQYLQSHAYKVGAALYVARPEPRP